MHTYLISMVNMGSLIISSALPLPLSLWYTSEIAIPALEAVTKQSLKNRLKNRLAAHSQLVQSLV